MGAVDLLFNVGPESLSVIRSGQRATLGSECAMSPRRLAIIPARGGSKRIADKNIRAFCGRPMIAHILDTARASGLFEVIHVSTESPRIASVVEALGFEVHFPRPIAQLADDKTPLMPVLRYVTETFQSRGQTFDEVWLLMACAPLIEAERPASRHSFSCAQTNPKPYLQ